jgi:protein-tyrosine phosphatase
MDVLVTLGGFLPLCQDTPGPKIILWYPLQDFGGAPEDWRQYLETEVIPLLRTGKKLAVFCYAGHGRTGMLLASLIALLEDQMETPDPIAALRERYCHEAVETTAQEAAVYALRA